MIVGRDTAAMTEPDVARAAIESAAENLSDGVVAPVFWYLILGLPGIVAYKLVNTADSMIGHMTPRYREFGWASARLDDVLNLIPARLTALLIALTHGWVDPAPILRDAPKHRSPNAGWPEGCPGPGPERRPLRPAQLQRRAQGLSLGLARRPPRPRPR